MRKIVVVIWAAVALMACSSQGYEAEQEAVAQPLDTAAVVEAVNDIYRDVFNVYAKARNMLRPLRRGSIDAEFCSTDWNQWVQRVVDYDKANSEGMVGFFDADYWIMGQDWQDLSVSDVHVKSLTDMTATVALQLHNCGSATDVCLEMVCDDGKWKIDNFIDVTNHVDWKASMKSYLEGNE